MDETLPPRKPPRHGAAASDAGMEADETQTLPDARERLGSYIVEAKIGEGGMGKVFRCHDPSLKRSVAVKVLHERYGRDDYYKARFRREAETLASLSHGAIAQIFAIDTTADGSLFIVMEYVEGRSVDDVLRSDGVLPVDKAIELTRQVAEGLQAASAKGVIHRDIKPSNLLLRPNGEVKIVDFGLSKELTKNNTITDEGMVMGTPHYISPEQGRGHDVDERSDIYSLGASLYHIVTGAPPFDGKSQIAVIVSHVEDDPPPPHEVRSDVPESLTWVIGRMMAKDPGSRYPSYDQLIADLRSLESRRAPEHAGNEIGRFGSPPVRRASKLTVPLLLTLLLLVGIAGGWLVARSAEKTAKFAHASRLGEWYRPRRDGGALFTFDFGRPPREDASVLEHAFVFGVIDHDPSDGVLPAEPGLDTQNGLLRWNEDATAAACRFPFEQLDEAQLVIGELNGRALDVAISVVDPLGSKRRHLTIRLSSRQETANPVVAERHGNPVEDLAEDGPRAPTIPPLFRFPAKLIIEMSTESDRTEVVLTVIETRNNEERFRQRSVFPGTDWASGAVVVRASHGAVPFSFTLKELVLSGRPTGERLEELPWHD